MLTVDRLVFLVPLAVGTLLAVADFRYYIISYLVARFVAVVFIIIKARGFFSSQILPANEAISISIHSIYVGIKLTVSYLAGTFVIGIGRFVADWVWGIETFGQLSFALSIVNFAITLIVQVGMVLFPALRQVDDQELRYIVMRLRNLFDIILPLIYVFFPLLSLFVSWWLPQYDQGLRWLGILLPICIFNGRMEILGSTVFKVKRHETILMAINLLTVLLSACGCYVSAFLFHSINGLVTAMLISVIVRSIVSETIVATMLNQRFIQSIVGNIIISIAFIVINDYAAPLTAFIILAGIYGLFLLFERNKVTNLTSHVAKHIKNK